MSDSSRRKLDVDYAILNMMGRRVEKIHNAKKAYKDLQTQVINVESDIEDLFDTDKINDLLEVSEINDFVCKIGEIKHNFRRIHA